MKNKPGTRPEKSAAQSKGLLSFFKSRTPRSNPMWQILFDLLPHLTRLVPMADRFFATRTASEKANEAALAALAASVRADLSQMGDTHASLSQQLADQGAVLADQSVILAASAQDAARARIAIQSVEARLSTLERRADHAMKLVTVVLVLLSSALVLLAIILARLSHR
jgi:hypothetical protein